MIPTRRFFLAFVISLLLGLLMGVAALNELQETRTLTATFPTTEATVTDVTWDEVGATQNKRWSCFVTYEYQVGKRSYQGRTDAFTEFDEPAVGDCIEIYYNPRVPKDSHVNKFMELWFGPLVSFIFWGICPLLLSGYFLSRALRRCR